MDSIDLPTGLSRTNHSRIRASYTPRNYAQARFGADLGDADLPLPEPAGVKVNDET